jgi:hypothetical protein
MSRLLTYVPFFNVCVCMSVCETTSILNLKEVGFPLVL